SGIPLWAPSAPRSPGHRLRDSAKADVVIVGAGITGALIARSLAQRGLSIIVLDRREPAHGSTMASTALLQWEIDTPLVRLADRSGSSGRAGPGGAVAAPWLILSDWLATTGFAAASPPAGRFFWLGRC